MSEVKLRNLLGQDVRALSKEQAAAYGLVAGYAGPVGHAAKARIVVDDSVANAGGLISGANRIDYHLAGVTYGRDYRAEKIGDSAVATQGMACVHCGSPLEERRGIEAANTFKLGTRYSGTMNARYLDERGVSQPMVMLLWPRHHPRAGLCLGAPSRRRRDHLAAQRRAVSVSSALGWNGRGDLPGRRSRLYRARRR
jgi:hypothetical protein